MCGIVGYVGKQEAAPVLLDALSKLEYRGYDSAGLATLAGDRLFYGKDTGRLLEVVARHHLDALPGNAGIGHTRWATHGGVSSANAHPHLDCHGEIAIVHNGIIENYEDLRRRLAARHHFLSETDSEVIPHLIEEYMASGYSLQRAVCTVVKELSGSYAILAISSREPGKIVAARRESPLVAGLGTQGNYLSSDALSFHNAVQRLLFVEDGECVVVTADKVAIFDSSGKEVRRAPVKIDPMQDELTKGVYDFFMLKEIHEQPQAIRRAIVQDRETLKEMSDEIRRARQVVFTACGTSRYAALIGRYAFSRIAGKFSEVVMASEFKYFSDSVGPDTLVLAISQSGETADVLDGVKRAKERGARVFSLVNVTGSSLVRLSDRTLYLNCGPEVGVAATKSFMAQLTVLYLLAFSMADLCDEGIHMLTSVSALIDENLKQNWSEVARIARKLKDRHDFYYIARGINFAVAGEAALKLKEVAYVHAEGMPAGELKHGTLALIEKDTPVIAICPHDYTFEDILSNVAETRARGAFVVGVSDREESVFNEWIKVPIVEEFFYPMVTVIPLQLFAYHSAVIRALDPDRPRNLAKSVTVK